MELAKFITAFKYKCPVTDIRIIAHSLGALVVEGTLVSMVKDRQGLNLSNSLPKTITSVHLLGAAINNKVIANNNLFGNATEQVVDKFVNLYNSQDDGLEINILYENRIPFGLLGVSLENATLNYHPLGLVGSVGVHPDNRPLNYNETNVVNEILAISDADGDGNVEECFENIKPVLVDGDNHCGYIGFRQPFLPSVFDDGAMDVVIRDWRQ